jgi:hypothetical protein
MLRGRKKGKKREEVAKKKKEEREMKSEKEERENIFVE